ncbi:hypothetical protein [Streptomyces sp. NPDC086182]|jgi:hypothetical protein|uniref:hypothetical protein n=1 Tax=Streptomyces sp. NPDC086182 TaxID=3155058 RepID=UPI00342A3F95
MRSTGEALRAPTGIQAHDNGEIPMGNKVETPDDSGETQNDAEVTPWNGTALQT